MSETLAVEGLACKHCADTLEAVDGDAATDALVAAVGGTGDEATSYREAPAP
jgi:copper chaperone CopZ